jgi:hypothetical protein
VSYEAFKYGYDLWEYNPIGCWTNETIGSWLDTRTGFRLDADWLLGRHGLRAGVDAARNTPGSLERSSGGVKYIIGPNEGMYPELADDVQLVQTEHWSLGGDFETTAKAAYLQDRWSPNRSLTLNLGVRWQRQEGRNGLGKTFIRSDDGFAPRFGFAWDPSGDGRSQVFGSYGVYFMPVPAELSVHFGAAEYHTLTMHTLDGDVLPDGSPEGVGDLLYEDVFADGDVRDPREVVANHMAPASQRELIVGYRRILGGHWSFGLRGVARQLDEAIEDFTINEGVERVYGQRIPDPQIRIGNPGSDFDGFCDIDADGVLDEVFIPAEALAYPSPRRDYYAVELSFDRRFADRWMAGGSYTWSQLYGNYEGLTNSDFAPQIMAWDGLTRTFDWPGLMEHASGDLPNDRRHGVKFFGSYASRVGLTVGGFFSFYSGRPVNSFGFHPEDSWRLLYGARAFYTDGEPRPRGCCGRTDNMWSMDLMLGYSFRIAGTDWNLRADAFNLFNNDSAVVFDEVGEYFIRVPNGNYGKPIHYQSPRTIRIGIGVSF